MTNPDSGPSDPTLDIQSSPTADSAAAATDAAPIREGPGTRVGPYKLLQLIGEGGFGSVFLAEQERPVVRKVALKIIKLGMDTLQVVARFEQERQALAILDHPNIAKVFDAGATETGRPYFVMELVKGEPLSEYADRNNLSIEDRLELFAQVCGAVQHAHTKGIIHRDLKPGNVLVASQDGKPSAKVIDFGIAKATASRMTEKTLFTEHKQVIGTPEYMSPEQAEGSPDIDTRTDVYALGVMLYELLTGTTPFSGMELRSAAYAEIQRIIREVEPPKPSTRLSKNTDTLASVAARRRTEPRHLGTIVRGELDWIVMKALEKDRARRYETANGLAMDIRRYLSGEAVVAAPPSTTYRFKKFVKRNRVTVSAGTAVAAALLVGVVAFAWQAKVASDQRDIAVAAQQAEAEQRERAEAARAEAVAQEVEARKQAAIAQAVARFQTDMLSAVNPVLMPRDAATGEPLRDRVTVVQAIEAAVRKLDLDDGDGSLKDQPLVEAGVRAAIGNTLQELGRYADAEPNLRRALTLRRAALPGGHPDIAIAARDLASVLYLQDKSAEAQSLSREALNLLRAARPDGRLEIAALLDLVARLADRQGKHEEAEPLFRESLALRREVLPAVHPVVASSLSNLADCLRLRNRIAEAEQLHREALAIRRAALPADHPELGASLNNLAALLRLQNKVAEAEPLYREALALMRASMPEGHPAVAVSASNLATFLESQNKPAEAELLGREALAIWRAALPAGHPLIARGLDNLAGYLQEQGKFAEAELLRREALVIWRAALPPGHMNTIQCELYITNLLLAQGKIAEAEPIARETLATCRQALEPGHPDIVTALIQLARVQQALGKTADALAGWDETIAILRKGSPEGSPLFARVLWRSGSTRLENKDAAAALPGLQEAVAMAEKVLPADHPQLKEYRETLARCKAALAGGAEPATPDTKGGRE